MVVSSGVDARTSVFARSAEFQCVAVPGRREALALAESCMACDRVTTPASVLDLVAHGRGVRVVTFRCECGLSWLRRRKGARLDD